MEPEPKILKPDKKGAHETQNYSFQSTEYMMLLKNLTPCDFCFTLKVPLPFESIAPLSTP